MDSTNNNNNNNNSSLTADYIEKMVKLAKIYHFEGKSFDESPELAEFGKKHQMLLNTIKDSTFNEEIFKQMMKCKRQLENGVNPYSVDVKFGTFMKEKYIDPVLPKATKK